MRDCRNVLHAFARLRGKSKNTIATAQANESAPISRE